MKLVAYGSLMNQQSLETTLGRSVILTKLSLKGWRRVYNAPFDGYAFLNLEKHDDTCIEAAYFELDEDELSLFAEREAGSELVEVRDGYFAFVWPLDYCRQLPALQSYVSICKAAAEELEINFASGLVKPSAVVDDLMKPRYRA